MNVTSNMTWLVPFLALSDLGWAAEPAVKTSTLTMAEFLAFDVPVYKVEKLGLEEAVEKLRAVVKEQTGNDAPFAHFPQ